jgi:hypothetical protein
MQGELKEVNTLLVILGTWLGAIDAWVCWRERLNGKAWFRGLSGMVIAGWGGCG